MFAVRHRISGTVEHSDGDVFLFDTRADALAFIDDALYGLHGSYEVVPA